MLDVFTVKPPRLSSSSLGLISILLTVLCWAVAEVCCPRFVYGATLEPFVAAILAWLWFGQTLTLLQILGGVLIILLPLQCNYGSLPSLPNRN